MNKKNISKALSAKLDRWVDSIKDPEIKLLVKDNAIVTGGALVSLLNGEPANDYDVYFKTFEACKRISLYYAHIWNETHDRKVIVSEKPDFNWNPSDAVPFGQIAQEWERYSAELPDNQKRIWLHILHGGIAAENGESGIDDDTEERESPDTDDAKPEAQDSTTELYRPRYFSTNAITLSDKIQIVVRFHGEVGEIHKNYDFVHCTCSFDYRTREVSLPSDALEAIINKELLYVGSKYPLCSIIRTRKFIERGWHINAGQYLKMCLQLNELNLLDLSVFADQLVGVDSAYFSKAIEQVKKKQETDSEFKPTNGYLFEIIDRIF